MAFEYVQANASTTLGSKFATERVVVGADTLDFPISLISFGPDGGPFVLVTTSAGLPVAQQGTWTVTGTGGSFPVTDSGGSLTIDNSTLAVVGGGTEAAAMRVTIASNSTGVLTVAGTGSFVAQISELIPGTSAADLGKAIDSVAGATDTGVAVLAVRDDALTTLTPVDGDYVPLRVNSTGALHVTGGGGGTQYAVDDALGANPTGTATLAKRDDALSALTPVEGDAVELRVDANGALWVAVSGTVTVGSHAVTNTTLSVVGGGTEATALRVTIASDSTGVLSVDDNGGSLTVDGTVAATQSGTWNIATVTTVTAVTAITNALPAGTNAIGKLAANSGVDIGDVDVTSIIPGTGATNLGKAIDTAAGATDTGVAALAIRDDALSALTPIEGDYNALRVDANGALWVIPSGTVTVAGAVTNAALSVVGGGVEATSLRVTIASDSTGVLSIDDNGGAITVDGTVAVSGTVTIAGAVTNAGTFAVQAAGNTATDAPITALPLTIGGRASNATPTLVSANGDVVDLWMTRAGAAVIDGSLIDDAAYVPAGTRVVPVGYFFDDVTPDSVDEGDIGAGRMSANRCQYMVIRDNAGNERGLVIDASGFLTANINGTVTVGSHAVTNAGTFQVQIDAGAVTSLALLDDGIATVASAITTKGMAAVGTDGTNARIIKTDTSGELQVDVLTMPSVAVTNVGTFAVQIDAGAVTSLALLDDGIATVASAITTKGMAAVGTDGTNARILKTDTSGELQVDVLTMPTVTVNAHAVTNAGTFVVQIDGAALTALQLADNIAAAIYVDDAAFTPATSSVLGIGLQADETATDSVDEGDIGCPRMTLDRKAIVSSYAHTAGGATPGKLIGAATENATVVKASAGQLFLLTAMNISATPVYLKFYNKATTPSEADTPVLVFMVPGNTAGAGFVIPIPPCGIEFTTGISFRLVTGIADADDTAPTASQQIISYAYK